MKIWRWRCSRHLHNHVFLLCEKFQCLKFRYTEVIHKKHFLSFLEVNNCVWYLWYVHKLAFPSVPISNNFTSFLFEKQYLFIYHVVVSRGFFWARNNKTDIYFNLLPFQASLWVHRNHPLISKCFLYNDNTANLRHYVLHILFSTFLKTFFTPFPKCST